MSSASSMHLRRSATVTWRGWMLWKRKLMTAIVSLKIFRRMSFCLGFLTLRSVDINEVALLARDNVFHDREKQGGE